MKSGLKTPITELVKANLKHLAQRLLAETRGVLLLPHVGVDGDAIGSSLAIGHVLTLLGIKSVVVVDEPVPDSLRFIPESERAVFVGDFSEDTRDFGFALLIDCHETSRIGKREALVRQDIELGSIDHHESHIEQSELDVIDKTASSTAELVFHLVNALKENHVTADDLFNRTVASQLMAGIISDTGRFSYSNVSPDTFNIASILLTYEPDIVSLSYQLFERTNLGALRMKGLVFARAKAYNAGRILVSTVPLRLIEACGSSEYHLNTIPSELKNVAGVAAAFLIRETEKKGEIRVNIRTDKRIHAADLAKTFSGGGHARAAGLTVKDSTLDEVSQMMIEAASKVLESQDGD